MSATIEKARIAALRNVVDLRAFAADETAGTPSAEAGDAWFAARRLVPGTGEVVTLAVMTLDGTGHVAALPADEFVFVLSGRLTVGETVIEANRGAMCPKGIAFGWRADGETKAIVMRCDGEPGADAPVPIDLDAPLMPSKSPAEHLLRSETPACRNHTDYSSASGEFAAGVWDSTPYTRVHIDYPHCELMHLLKGSVTFADESGTERTFREDDLFVVLQGARCSWLSLEDVAKVWVIYRPAA